MEGTSAQPVAREGSRRIGGSWRLAGILWVAWLLAGCVGQTDRLQRFDRLYRQGRLDAAEALLEQTLPDESARPPQGSDLLWALQRGTLERLQGDYATSNRWFDRAEEMIKAYDFDSGWLDGVGTTLVNEQVVPYRGTTYDGIMVNTYKALNFMSLGQDDLARVEFNRVGERQRRAQERFSQEIQKEREALKKKQTNRKIDYDKTLDREALEEKVRQTYSSLYEFEAYPDFVNPFSTYLGGLFFMITDDPAKAVDLLKESAGMVSDRCPVVMEDFAAVDRWLETGQAPPPAVWVIYENGVGPIKEEFRIDLPLYLASRDVLYAGVALPRLVPRSAASSGLTARAAGQSVRTAEVADMDRVIQTEFAKAFPQILMRAVVGAAAKVVIQDQLSDQNGTTGQLLAFAAAVYSHITTQADLRIWSSLPKRFEVARLDMPADHRIELDFGQGGGIDVVFDPCRYAVVYVRRVTASSPPIVEVICRGPAPVETTDS